MWAEYEPGFRGVNAGLPLCRLPLAARGVAIRQSAPLIGLPLPCWPFTLVAMRMTDRGIDSAGGPSRRIARSGEANRRLVLAVPLLIATLGFFAFASHAAEHSLPGPASDPADLTVWPNQTSRANSDRWLVEHHDQIRRLNPRVLLLNFSIKATREHLDQLTRDLIAAIAEGSRYHGYQDPKAPPFLNYQVFKFVDLRDADSTQPNSSKAPRRGKPTGQNAYREQFNVNYPALFNDTYAGYYGVRDPKKPDRFLPLAELFDGGYIHEVWFFAEHVADYVPFESIELKAVYDEQFRRVGEKFVQAGNGGDPEQPWTGRSVRLGFINASRGIGCFLESLSHSFEGAANSRAVPYLTRYFREFAGFDLNQRYKLPWDSFYPLWGEGKEVAYPDPHTAIAKDGAKTYRLEDYVAFGGNVHFPPNGRRHYDLENTQPVMSTIEDWRIGSGPGGKDLAKPWTNEAFAKYRTLAPDCMGPWLIYWRQNFPGLDNRQKDDAGKPMKNWWPFLFY